jgi:hypothetical protein
LILPQRVIIEEYSTLSWETYCTEVATLKVELPPREETSDGLATSPKAGTNGNWEAVPNNSR